MKDNPETKSTTPRSASDENLAAIIGKNLRQVRTQRGFSLDEVSEKCDVSKSMLSEIERGVKSPTITVLYRICDGIHVSFNSILKRPEAMVEIVHEQEVEKFGNIDIQMLFPHDPVSPLEVSKNHLSPHTYHKGYSHGDNTWEYVIVTEGVFTLILGEEKYEIRQGESLRFRADRYHIYANETDDEVNIINLALYES